MKSLDPGPRGSRGPTLDDHAVPQLWREVRELHAALVELDDSGRALAELRGVGWSSPSESGPAAGGPEIGAPFADSALVLDPDRQVEIARQARQLEGDPRQALVTIADGRLALLDPRDGAADGLVLEARWLGDPCWRIVPVGP